MELVAAGVLCGAVVDDGFGDVAAGVVDSCWADDGLGVVASVLSAVLSVVLDDFFFGFAGLVAFGGVGETTSPLTEVTGLVGELLGGDDPSDPEPVVGDSVDGDVVPDVPAGVEELDSEPDGAESGSAHAGAAAIADPTPSATANAPTRPTYFAQPMTNPPHRTKLPPGSPKSAAGRSRRPSRVDGMSAVRSWNGPAHAVLAANVARS